MTTAKKILTLALCLTCLTAGMTGCAKDKSSSDTKIAKSTSSQSESSDSEKIKELNDKLEKLENTLSNILGEDIFDPADGDGNVNGEIHPIYNPLISFNPLCYYQNNQAHTHNLFREHLRKPLKACRNQCRVHCLCHKNYPNRHHLPSLKKFQSKPCPLRQ